LILQPERAWIDLNEPIVQPIVTAARDDADILAFERADDMNILHVRSDRHKDASRVLGTSGEEPARAAKEMPFRSTCGASAGRARLS